MRALVTGIAGFVGPFLAQFLKEEGVDVFGLVLPQELQVASSKLSNTTKLLEGDVRDLARLEEVVLDVCPDYIVHLAAVTSVPMSFQEPKLTYDVNIGGTVNLFEAVRRLGREVRILNVSSAHVYGSLESDDAGFDEEAKLCPMSPYAVTKVIGEELASSYVRDFGLDIVNVRPFNHTGPGQSDIFFCSSFARQVVQIRLGGRPPVLYTGNLDARRDVMDVRDVVRAYFAILCKGKKGEVYNVCSGKVQSVRSILETLVRLAGIEASIVTDPARLRASDVRTLGGNCRRLFDETGWIPQIPMQQTLADLVQYWQSMIPSSK